MKAWPLSLSDPSSSLVLPGRPRLTDALAPCLSPVPQPVLSRCAVERAQDHIDLRSAGHVPR